MAKLKQPLGSFKAHGSLGSFLTFSKFRSTTVAKRIPTHPDARTLPQLYQRWRYYDAVQYWHSLSLAQQQAYRTLGVPHHLTAYQMFIRTYLRSPIDQVLWLRMDAPTPTTVHDFSLTGNDGTITGCTRAPGIIDGCLQWDGLDDWILCPTNDTLDITHADFTIMLWLNAEQIADWNTFLWKYDAGIGLIYAAEHIPPWRAYFQHYYPGGSCNLYCTTVIADNWNHVTFKRESNVGYLLINGVQENTAPYTGNTRRPTIDLRFGGRHDLGLQRFDGLIDDIRVYNRALSHDHIKVIATQELYPPSS